MTRRMQVRDVNEPIEGIVREWADREGVSALRYSELVRDLQDEVGWLIGRAQAEAYDFQAVEGAADADHEPPSATWGDHDEEPT